MTDILATINPQIIQNDQAANSFTEKEKSDLEFIQKLCDTSPKDDDDDIALIGKLLIDAIPYPTHNEDGLPYVKWENVPNNSLVLYGKDMYAVRINDRGWWISSFYKNGWQGGPGWPWTSYIMRNEGCVVLSPNIIGWESVDELEKLGVKFEPKTEKLPNRSHPPEFLTPTEWSNIIETDTIIQVKSHGYLICSENKLYWAASKNEIFWKEEYWGVRESSIEEFFNNIKFEKNDLCTLQKTSKTAAIIDLLKIFRENNITPKNFKLEVVV